MKTKHPISVGFGFLLLPVLFVIACAQGENAAIRPELSESMTPSAEEILFIGNSHTYYNSGIPFHVNRFRANDALPYEPFIREVSFAGFSLTEHLANATTMAKVEERDWEIIVLQENTTVASNDGSSTLQAVKAFRELVGQKGTKIYLFMTWPYKDRPEMFPPIKKTYQEAATATGVNLVPVGEVWLSILEEGEENIKLYDDDGIHPSMQGTFLTASLFYSAIFNKNPSDNQYKAGLDPETAQYLKSKAD